MKNPEIKYGTLITFTLLCCVLSCCKRQALNKRAKYLKSAIVLSFKGFHFTATIFCLAWIFAGKAVSCPRNELKIKDAMLLKTKNKNVTVLLCLNFSYNLVSKKINKARKKEKKKARLRKIDLPKRMTYDANI